MSRTLKMMLCITIAILLVITSACSSSKTSEPAATDSPKAIAAVSSSTPEAVEPVKYDPPIEITTFRSTSETLEQNLPQGETLDKNRWLDLYAQELGINVKYTWVAKAGDQYDQKINTSFAAGDIPEIIPVNLIQLKQLSDSDQIMDLTKVFEKYATPLTKEIMLQEGDHPFNAAKFGGKLMGIPSTASSKEGQNFIWLREDWLKNVNLPVPKTMDDLVKVMEAFTKNDPDKNGKNDTFGLGVIKELLGPPLGLGYSVLDGLFNGYHAYPNIWVKDSSGNLVYGSTMKEMLAPLTKLNELYKEGVIDPEFGTKDTGKLVQDTIAGKNGLFFGQHWNFAYPIQPTHDANVKADYQAYPLVSIDDQMAKTQAGLGTLTWYAVKKGSKHPEAIVKMLNVFLEKNFGKTNEFGKYYRDTKNHELWSLSPFVALPPNKNIDNNISILDAIAKNDPSKLDPESMSVWDNVMKYKNDKDEKNQGWFKAFSPGGVGNLMVSYAKEQRHIYNEFYGVPGDVMKKNSATLLKFQNEMFTKFIMGSEPLSNFDKFVADYNKLGGNAVAQEVNDWYKSVQTK